MQSDDRDPWARTRKRVTPSRQLPSFNWVMIDKELLLGIAFGIGVLSLAIAGVQAILPDREPCAPSDCHNIAPIAIALSGDGEAVAFTYLPCGSEYVQGVTVADAMSGEHLWAAQTSRASTRDVFVLGEIVQPYEELIELEEPLSGRYTVTVQANEIHTAVFHTRELTADAVIFNGIPLSEDEWQAEARRFGDCAFWKAPSGIRRAELLGLGIGLMAVAMAAWTAYRSIHDQPDNL